MERSWSYNGPTPFDPCPPPPIYLYLDVSSHQKRPDGRLPDCQAQANDEQFAWQRSDRHGLMGEGRDIRQD